MPTAARLKPFKFATSCVLCSQADVEALHEMVDNGRQITVETFLKHCDLKDTDFTAKSLREDWHVRFFKSRFSGKPCYYVDHSAIEHIFTKGA